MQLASHLDISGLSLLSPDGLLSSSFTDISWTPASFRCLLLDTCRPFMSPGGYLSASTVTCWIPGIFCCHLLDTLSSSAVTCWTPVIFHFHLSNVSRHLPLPACGHLSVSYVTCWTPVILVLSPAECLTSC